MNENFDVWHCICKSTLSNHDHHYKLNCNFECNLNGGNCVTNINLEHLCYNYFLLKTFLVSYRFTTEIFMIFQVLQWSCDCFGLSKPVSFHHNCLQLLFLHLFGKSWAFGKVNKIEIIVFSLIIYSFVFLIVKVCIKVIKYLKFTNLRCQ